MREGLNALYRLFSSMRLSVYLLGFALILVFFGTLDQVHYGIYETQRRYFQSIIAFWNYPREWAFGDVLGFLVIPMPGGYLLGTAFLANLACAHFKYFRPRWSVFGIAMIHLGLALLLIGQMVTDLVQEDYRMWINEHGKSTYAESFLHNELAIIETTDPEINRVWSIPQRMLKSGKVYSPDGLPFAINIQHFFLNAQIMDLQEGQTAGWLRTSRGVANRRRLAVIPARPVYSQNESNVTTAVVELSGKDGSLGNWLVSNVFGDLFPTQEFEVEGRRFEIALRFQRLYFPFDIHLNDFTHDRYPGTDIPRNFSSRVRVTDHETGEERDALIYMNHPMRYGGYTFYQHSFAQNDTVSGLQVVRNPGWIIPYASCLMIAFGMLYQFGWTLTRFTGRMRK